LRDRRHATLNPETHELDWSQLPASYAPEQCSSGVRAGQLPEHGQNIFREAFNHALTEYQDEERGSRGAWAGGKASVREGADGYWVRKSFADPH
jgi:cation transport regulator